MPTKVMKFQVQYLDGCGDFHTFQKETWALQSQTQRILNRTIQMAYLWEAQCREHYAKTGENLEITAHSNRGKPYKDYAGYIYNQLKDEFLDLSSGNLISTIQIAWKKFKDCKKEVFLGTMSLPSYRRDQPLVIRKDAIEIREYDDGWCAETVLFSRAFQKRTSLNSRVRFKLYEKDKTQKTILERLITGEYKWGECQLTYEKKKWFLSVTYSFDKIPVTFDEKKILGVDLGTVYVICASVFGEYERFTIKGDKTLEYAHILEERKKSRQAQAQYCGEGRIGHGTKTRVKAVYRDRDRLSNHQSTLNHQYSRALVDYAIKHGCGIIQMEDLSGIKEHTGYPRRLQHWTYYDLQTKVAAKAAEAGITVKKVDPRYTSQRCSRCGHIDRANRPTQDKFLCTACGYQANADYNASQNLAIAGIDKIIKKSAPLANEEQT